MDLKGGRRLATAESLLRTFESISRRGRGDVNVFSPVVNGSNMIKTWLVGGGKK